MSRFVRVGCSSVELDHKPPPCIAHIAIPTPGSVGLCAVVLAGGEAMRPFHPATPSPLQRRQHAVANIGQHLDDQRPPSNAPAQCRCGADALGSRSATLARSGDPPDHVVDPLLLLDEIEHGFLNSSLRRATRWVRALDKASAAMRDQALLALDAPTSWHRDLDDRGKRVLDPL